MTSNPDEATLVIHQDGREPVAGLLIGRDLAIAPCGISEDPIAAAPAAAPHHQVELAFHDRVNLSDTFDLGLWTVTGAEAARCSLHKVTDLAGLTLEVYRPVVHSHESPGRQHRVSLAAVDPSSVQLADPQTGSHPANWSLNEPAVLGSPVVCNGSIVGIVASSEEDHRYLVSVEGLTNLLPEIAPWTGWRVFDIPSLQRLWLGSSGRSPLGYQDRFTDRHVELRTLAERDDDRAPVILVSGESGSGKSSVVARFAAERDPAIHRILDSRTPDEPWMPGVQAYVRLHQGEPGDRESLAPREVRDLPLRIAELIEVTDPGWLAYIEEARAAVDRFGRLNEAWPRPTISPLVIVDGVTTTDALERVLNGVQRCAKLRFIICVQSDAGIDPELLAGLDPVQVTRQVDDDDIRTYLEGLGFDAARTAEGVLFAQGHLLLAGLFQPGHERRPSDGPDPVAENVRFLVAGIIEDAPPPIRLLLPHLNQQQPVQLVDALLERLGAGQTLRHAMTGFAGLHQILDVTHLTAEVSHDLFSAALRDIVEDPDGLVLNALLSLDPSSLEAASRTAWSEMTCSTAARHGRLGDLIASDQLLKMVDLSHLAPMLRRFPSEGPRSQLLESFDESISSEDWFESVALVLSGSEKHSVPQSEPESHLFIEWRRTTGYLAHWRPVTVDVGDFDLTRTRESDTGAIALSAMTNTVEIGGGGPPFAFNVHPDYTANISEVQVGARRLVVTTSGSGEQGIATIVELPAAPAANHDENGDEADFDLGPESDSDLAGEPKRSMAVVGTVGTDRMTVFAYVDGVVEIQRHRTVFGQLEMERTLHRKTWSVVRSLRLVGGVVECLSDAGVMTIGIRSRSEPGRKGPWGSSSPA